MSKTRPNNAACALRMAGVPRHRRERASRTIYSSNSRRVYWDEVTDHREASAVSLNIMFQSERETHKVMKNAVILQPPTPP